MDHPEHFQRPTETRGKRKFILCFDGTGNKFSGTSSDSSILKIYRMLDREDETQLHYYQPGIGTYVTSATLSPPSTYQSFKAWYTKQKDSAVGTSLSDHVMGGYKFLMRYYLPGDKIYFFGFSRGAYTARFLAEMLDYVGLITTGNEEMAGFAWKTFEKWQMREERTEEEKKKKRELREFMTAFRETFSRPVEPLEFLGLFDTVNSVPRFENAFMQRSKFPYTARSSAKVIRHAVSIDERRAKFRPDLLYQPPGKARRHHFWHHDRQFGHLSAAIEGRRKERNGGEDSKLQPQDKFRPKRRPNPPRFSPRSSSMQVQERFRDPSEASGLDSASRRSQGTSSASATDAVHTAAGEQDIKEVWFVGCHGDLGGGWAMDLDKPAPLSHIPLVWMINEAERAGLNFDDTKLRKLNCAPDVERREGQQQSVEGSGEVDGSQFHRILHELSIGGRTHDALRRNNGASLMSVLGWNIMEWLPFRRMDLKEDESWTSISWPLPRGEVRDFPDNAVLHNSVVKRMMADEAYRPGNVICGGGGRGMRRAPEKYGYGKWKVLENEGDPVLELYIRDGPRPALEV
ncbi:hypothetical protein P152DRAFT_429712 [Eremomyces bilateralis CBS 781.70]|uniref:T6SS Phospholipase effector Tle1-like catalytic domain-containing protein n=1 Tax=Eremomyces bilateralis CBS 781.70 TaxID=1392243 RepID=A0A6G1GCD8_9PEZI|nr:uncharacterized protein P152DRAFT_429712 [Eremomyces bilateralis CBS 781.70]KAF1815586.1 hypothetical protein P152DRAFT_429712 [Eremomyces bilateralis CBS 781.70]